MDQYCTTKKNLAKDDQEIIENRKSRHPASFSHHHCAFNKFLSNVWNIFKKQTYSPPPSPMATLPPRILSARYVKAHLTRTKCSSVTCATLVGIWHASSPPSLPSHLGCGNAPYALPLLQHSRLPYATSVSPAPSLTPKLIKPHLAVPPGSLPRSISRSGSRVNRLKNQVQ